jgi:catechol 2,3-dioxygenase-like lactoylglutathione lyase family enzyme
MNQSFIDQVHYIRIPVRDLATASVWYRDVLGFQLLSITDDPFALMKVNEGPLLIVLVPTTEETYAHFSVNGESAFCVGFTSPKLQEFHQHLSEQGVKVEDIKEDNGHAYFYFYDPDGNQLQAHW